MSKRRGPQIASSLSLSLARARAEVNWPLAPEIRPESTLTVGHLSHKYIYRSLILPHPGTEAVPFLQESAGVGLRYQALGICIVHFRRIRPSLVNEEGQNRSRKRTVGWCGFSSTAEYPIATPSQPPGAWSTLFSTWSEISKGNFGLRKSLNCFLHGVGIHGGILGARRQCCGVDLMGSRLSPT